MWLKIFLTTWKLINILADNPGIKRNIRAEIKHHLERDEKGNTLFPKPMGSGKKAQLGGNMYSPEMPSLLKKTKNKEAEDTS